MFTSFTPILAASPPDTRAAGSFGFPLAHLAYQVGSGSEGSGLQLRKGLIGASMRGGIMTLSDTDERRAGDIVTSDPTELLREVVRECNLRGFGGIVADFEHGVRRELSDFVKLADASLPAGGITLFVYELYAAYTTNARIIIPTAITSGALASRLREAASAYGINRVAVETERLARDIVLPSPQGSGRAMSREELRALLDDRRATVFYSGELCAHYFTYKDNEGQTHFILYDDAASINKKLALCRSMGIKEAFLLYPEVKDIISYLMS